MGLCGEQELHSWRADATHPRKPCFLDFMAATKLSLSVLSWLEGLPNVGEGRTGSPHAMRARRASTAPSSALPAALHRHTLFITGPLCWGSSRHRHKCALGDVVEGTAQGVAGTMWQDHVSHVSGGGQPARRHAAGTSATSEDMHSAGTSEGLLLSLTEGDGFALHPAQRVLAGQCLKGHTAQGPHIGRLTPGG